MPNIIKDVLNIFYLNSYENLDISMLPGQTLM